LGWACHRTLRAIYVHVQFAQLTTPRDLMAGVGLTRTTGQSKSRRWVATKRDGRPASETVRRSKAAHVVCLVDALGNGLGPERTAAVGRRIARLIADAYAERGRVPRWVGELVAHYARGDGHGP